MNIFYFSGPRHLILITPTAREASLLLRRFINLMCVRRHFSHKSRILGAGKFEARGFGKRDKKLSGGPRPGVGGAALGLGVGRGSVGRAPLRPPRREMALGCYIHQGCAATSSRPPVCRAGEPGGGCRGGTPRGRERDAIRVAARGRLGPPPPHSGRALPRRWRLGEAVIFFFFFGAAGEWWRGRWGGGARRGPVCVPLRAGALPPPRRRPEPHKRTGCC